MLVNGIISNFLKYPHNTNTIYIIKYVALNDLCRIWYSIKTDNKLKKTTSAWLTSKQFLEFFSLSLSSSRQH